MNYNIRRQQHAHRPTDSIVGHVSKVVAVAVDELNEPYKPCCRNRVYNGGSTVYSLPPPPLGSCLRLPYLGIAMLSLALPPLLSVLARAQEVLYTLNDATATL